MDYGKKYEGRPVIRLEKEDDRHTNNTPRLEPPVIQTDLFVITVTLTLPHFHALDRNHLWSSPSYNWLHYCLALCHSTKSKKFFT